MDLERATDEDLLRRFREGDEHAFTQLVVRHEDRIFSLAYRLTGDRNDALEAAQETFIAAFRRAETFRGDASFATWLYSIGVNASRDVLRRRPASAGVDESKSDANLSSGDLAESAAIRVDVSRALEALPHEYREAVVMHDLGGIRYEDIATLTGVAVGTVKSRISRGRQRLAGLLEQHAAHRTSKGRT